MFKFVKYYLNLLRLSIECWKIDRSYRPDLKKAKRENKKHEVDPLWAEWQGMRRPFREQIDELKSQRLERLADKNRIDLPPKGGPDFWEKQYRNFVLTKKGRFYVENKLQELKQKKGAYRIAWIALIFSLFSITQNFFGDKISTIFSKPKLELMIGHQTIEADTLTFKIGEPKKLTLIRVHNQGNLQADNIKIWLYIDDFESRLDIDNFYVVENRKTTWFPSKMSDESEYNLLYKTGVLWQRLNQDESSIFGIEIYPLMKKNAFMPAMLKVMYDKNPPQRMKFTIAVKSKGSS